MKKKLKVLDLFSGIGGFSLGLERAGMETIAFCEIDKHCQKILKKHWPEVPIFEDVTKLRNIPHVLNDHLTDGVEDFVHCDSIDVICGGFPCQDISIGGKGKGLKGKRSGLWEEFRRLINEIRPKFVIIENVERLRKKGLGIVLRDLSKIGYNAEWHCITAASIGLPHQRDRMWIISYSCSKRFNECSGEKRHLQTNKEWESEEVHSKGQQCELEPGEIRTILSKRAIESIKSAYSKSFTSVSLFHRVTDGFPGKLDERKRQQRIKQLGNAVVPQIPELIGREIIKWEAHCD